MIADKNYILAALPENYRLYEHLKYTISEETGKLQKSTRNHAKGPNDRQDAYLYGHPLGRKKRYRSPADFFPHLLWLATDKDGDRNNCACKICSPEEIQIVEKPQPSGQSRIKTEPSVKTEEVKPKPPVVSRVSAVAVPKRTASHDSPKPTVKALPASFAQPTIKTGPPPIPSPTPVATPKCYEQGLDAQYGKFLFRPGELVWFNRGSAWGLSVITKRELLKDNTQTDRPRYLVQPLSHPFGHPPLKIIPQEELLRPWLAWSAPGPTHEPLAAGGLTYDTVDWRAVLQGRYGPGDAEVDGSIFAAKAIDESYTLFQQLDVSTAAAGETHWNGIYLGGEKIWVGEPIRLRIGSGQDLMILHDIVDRARAGYPNANGSNNTTTYFVGDIYTYTTMMHTPGREPATNPALPMRLRHDLSYRNQATISTKGNVSFWKLMQTQARLSLAEVKGRWYESSLLLPILRGQADYQRDVRRGESSDAGMWMNGRGDSSVTNNPTNTNTGVSGKVGHKKFDRRDAFGRAVPAGTTISRGLDGPPGENDFPTETGSAGHPIALEEEQPAQLQHQHQHQHQQGVSDGDIEEFMNLDRLEESYVQQYAENGGHFADGFNLH